MLPVAISIVSLDWEKTHLVLGPSLRHKLVAHFDLRLQQVPVEVVTVQVQQLGDGLSLL